MNNHTNDAYGSTEDAGSSVVSARAGDPSPAHPRQHPVLPTVVGAKSINHHIIAPSVVPLHSASLADVGFAGAVSPPNPKDTSMESLISPINLMQTFDNNNTINTNNAAATNHPSQPQRCNSRSNSESEQGAPKASHQHPSFRRQSHQQPSQPQLVRVPTLTTGTPRRANGGIGGGGLHIGGTPTTGATAAADSSPPPNAFNVVEVSRTYSSIVAQNETSSTVIDGGAESSSVNRGGGGTVTATATAAGGTTAVNTALGTALTHAQQKEQAAEERRKEMRRKKRSLCTVPLMALFALLIVSIGAAIAAIITVSDVTSTKTSTDLIEDGIRSALRYAGAEVTGPITTIEALLNEYRDRYLAFMAINKNREPCDDLDPSFSGSAIFYSDSAVAIQSNPTLMSFFVVKRLSPINVSAATTADELDYDTPYESAISDEISLCSSSKTSIFKRLWLKGNSTSSNATNPYGADVITKETTRLPGLLEYGAPLDTNITVKPRASRLDYSYAHEGMQVITVLATKMFLWVPSVRFNATANAFEMILVGTGPVTYNVTTTDGKTTLYNRAVRGMRSFTVGKNGVLRMDVVSSLGATYSMAGFAGILRNVTASHPSAHTSLYEVGATLLATSIYADDEQLDRAAGKLYAAGRTPSADLNDAYEHCAFHEHSSGDLYINMGSGDGGVIITCYVFETPYSKLRFGAVQSTPRAHYFKPITDLRILMIALGCCCAFVVVTICLIVAFSIRSGVQQLLQNMSIAAALKNDQTHYIASYLTEVEALAKGFGRMNAKLLEARAYLPQHLLISSSDESSPDSDDDEEGTIDKASRAVSYRTSSNTNTSTHLTNNNTHTTTATTAAAAARGNNRGTNNAFGASDSDTNTMGSGLVLKKGHHPSLHSGGGGAANPSTAMTLGGGGGGTNTGGGPMMKRVTILALNLRGFHTAAVNCAVPASLSTPIALLTELVNTLAHGHKGMIDAFHGDHFVVSFNAARPNAEGPSKACRMALELINRYTMDCLTNSNAVAAAAGATAAPRGAGGAVGATSGNAIGGAAAELANRRCAAKTFSMGISTGKACVGNLGATSLKRLSIIGPVYSKAMALERVCRRFNNTNNSTYYDTNGLGATTNTHNSNDRANIAALIQQHGISPSAAGGIQCVLDGSVAREVQHTMLLQALGGLWGAPFTTTTTAATAAAGAPKKKTDGSPSLSAINPQTVVASPPPTALTLHQLDALYALRMQLQQDRAAAVGGDEWLYEMQSDDFLMGRGGGANNGVMLKQLNKSVIRYLDQCLARGGESDTTGIDGPYPSAPVDVLRESVEAIHASYAQQQRSSPPMAGGLNRGMGFDSVENICVAAEEDVEGYNGKLTDSSDLTMAKWAPLGDGLGGLPPMGLSLRDEDVIMADVMRYALRAVAAEEGPCRGDAAYNYGQRLCRGPAADGLGVPLLPPCVYSVYA